MQGQAVGAAQARLRLGGRGLIQTETSWRAALPQALSELRGCLSLVVLQAPQAQVALEAAVTHLALEARAVLGVLAAAVAVADQAAHRVMRAALAVSAAVPK